MQSVHARWQPAAAIAEQFAVHEAALFRYSQRGMLAARWDETLAIWTYDVTRIAELFLHRDQAPPQVPSGSFGVLGKIQLGGGSRRKPPVRSFSATDSEATVVQRKPGLAATG